ncbi:MAG: MMPL family transporter, partial [Candidatus Sericytochromatia bacterium]
LLRLLWLGSDHTAMILNSMLGLGLTIDYSLFMLSRYREERSSHEMPAALATVLSHTGRTVLYSAGVMFCSLLILLIPEVSGLRGTVYNLMLVIALAALNALLLLPLLLAALDGVLDRPRWLSRWILRWHSEARWRRLAEKVTAHPLRYGLLSLALLGLMAWPLTDLKLWEPRHSLAPAGSESVAGFDVLSADGWGGELLPILVMVYAPPGHSLLEDEMLERIYALTAGLEALPEVASVQGMVSSRQPLADYLTLYRSLRALQATGLAPDLPLLRQSPRGEVTLIRVHQRRMMHIEQAYPILEWLKAYQSSHPELKLLTGGVVARSRSFTAEMYRYTLPMIGLVLLSILILLSFYLRSLLLPIKAGIMNFLPILSGFGLLVWAYQWGGLGPPRPGITNIVPITLFCIVFGLSMDYEVLILSRIDEAWRLSGDVRAAVVSGLSRSSGIITGAALILMGVFGPGIFSSSPVVQEISLGISATILIDATLVRLLLVPSLMMLMGKWNWWHPWKKD